jgi:CheY-like chemotaxis protein
MNELKRILLVEDSPNDAELTLEALAEINLANEIKWLKDGEEVLDYLYLRGAYAGREPINPILILLDLKLPKVDGIQVLHEIRNDPRLMSIPVVIMTSSREESDLEGCYANGANAYVVKPVNYAEFVRAAKALGVSGLPSMSRRRSKRDGWRYGYGRLTTFSASGGQFRRC